LRAAEELPDEFFRQTGVQFETLRGVPAETLDQLSLVRKLFQQPTDSPDVIEVDETWLGAIKDDLADLAPYFPERAKSISPALESSYVIKGKFVAIPYQNHVGVLSYRADLLRKYGFDHPPATWTELEHMAIRIQNGERARGNKEFWGYLWPGAAEESLTCNALEWQFDEGGGRIIESNGTISVNNVAAIRSWERARHWIGWISPPSVTEYRESDALAVFAEGRGAFIRAWAGEPGENSTKQNPHLRVITWGLKGDETGEFGITAMPAGSVARAGVLGGLGLAVSKYSKYLQEDASLIRFLLEKELESFQPGNHRFPSQQSVIYDAAESTQTSSAVDPLRAIVIARPTTVGPQAYDKVSEAYSLAVHSVLTGNKSASDAASDLENELVGITGMQKGPPAQN
jgi:trehalose/maltose transport system substrate-binding protein